MKAPDWHYRGHLFLRAFVAGSLLLLLFCLALVCSFYTYTYVQKEKLRAKIALDQVSHFFEFHHENMSEEMWNGRFDAIGRRVALIARQLGHAHHTLYIADTLGGCTYAQGQSSRSHAQYQTLPCLLPVKFQEFISNRQLHENLEPILFFDDHAEKTLYMAPLAIGSFVRGYLYATFTDPYEFYRGSFLSIAGSTFVPISVAMLLLWLIWLLVSREFLLRPSLDYLKKAKADSDLANLARRTAHDMRDPITGLERMVSRMTNAHPDDNRYMQSFLFQLKDVANSLLAQSHMARPRRSARLRDETSASPTMLMPLLQSVVAAKRIQVSERSGIQIQYEEALQDWRLFVIAEAHELPRILSSLLNNAVQALLAGRGCILLKTVLSEQSDFVGIEVQDNGKGIPKSVRDFHAIGGLK